MINQFVPKIIDEISKIDTENELMNLKSKYLGKKGEFTIFTNSIKDLSIEEKKIQGPIINSVKKEIESIIADKFKNLKRLAIDKKLAEEKIDISLPSKCQKKLYKYLLNLVLRSLKVPKLNPITIILRL